jgi:hypothetical protein
MELWLGLSVHESGQWVAPVCEDVKQANFSLKNSDTSASSCYSSSDHEQDGKELHATRGRTIALCTCAWIEQNQPRSRKLLCTYERVEEIDTRTKMKRSTSTEKLPSIDPEEDVVQPVKSILPQHCQDHKLYTQNPKKVDINLENKKRG